MYLYRATGDSYLLQVGEDMLRSIEHSAKTPCGYATVINTELIKKKKHFIKNKFIETIFR